jgi:hypothetical protein
VFSLPWVDVCAPRRYGETVVGKSGFAFKNLRSAMTEEETTQVEEPAGADIAGESAPEQVTELAQDIHPQQGDAPKEAIDKLRPICSRADLNYTQVIELIKEMKSAESVLHRFHAGESGVTSEDVEAAKEKFNQAKQSYLQLGNQINDGIRQVYVMAKTYPQDLLVQNIYKTYLGKLLASLETRNPAQNFVELIAVGGFELERQDVGLFEEEGDKSSAQELEKKMLGETEDIVNMLEVRYQKRQLANRLRQGERPPKIISRLTALSRQDPTDINTYIWLANLWGGELKRERDQNRRISIRDDILDHCKKAFATIDDYLNLQGIENLNERDRMRAEYVKTITAIRKPLIEQSG